MVVLLLSLQVYGVDIIVVNILSIFCNYVSVRRLSSCSNYRQQWRCMRRNFATYDFWCQKQGVEPNREPVKNPFFSVNPNRTWTV